MQAGSCSPAPQPSAAAAAAASPAAKRSSASPSAPRELLGWSDDDRKAVLRSHAAANGTPEEMRHYELLPEGLLSRDKTLPLPLGTLPPKRLIFFHARARALSLSFSLLSLSPFLSLFLSLCLSPFLLPSLSTL